MTRRSFMMSSAPAAATALAAPAPPQTKPQDRPNILLIVSDQMRGDALGCLGNPNARTPNLDRMARMGVLFENCFSNNPVCIPSRKSLFSGRYPHQHGSLTNHQNTLLDLPGSMLGHFRKQGYRTGYVGKNHTFSKQAVGQIDSTSIRDREPFREYNQWSTPYWYSATYWPQEKCYPHLNTEAAIDFLNAHRTGDRFFLTVSYFDPHPPYFAPAEYLMRRNPEGIAVPRYIPPAALTPRLAEFSRALHLEEMGSADLKMAMHHYHAAVEWGVDHQVGRLLAALERKGLSNDTIVICTADHGDFMGHHHMAGKGMFLHDALLNVPMIWYAPGRIAQGFQSTALAQPIDVFPTVTGLAGTAVPGGLSGRSLEPFLRGSDADSPEHAIFTSAAYGRIDFERLPEGADEIALHTRVLKHAMTPAHRTSMARTREWKLVLNEEGPPELYHMAGGRLERGNLAGKNEHAAVRRGLEKRLTEWWQW